MNTAMKRALTFLVSLVLIVYVGYQAYRVLYNPLKTLRVTSGTYEDVIKTDGFVLHSETVISQKVNGVVDYVRQDGESVAKGGEVAAVFASEKDAENQRKIQMLESEIQSYQSIGSSANVDAIDVDVLNSELEKKFLELSKASDNDDVDSILTLKTELLSLFNKKQLVTGEISNFNAQINSLSKQKAELERSTGSKIGSITSPDAGYFVSSVDGLENAYNVNDILSISASDVKRLLSAKTSKPADAVGKIITGYDTYIVCTIDADEAYNLHVGDSLKLRFLLSSQGEIPVTVSAINKDSSGVALVLKSTVMTGALAVIRHQTVELVVGKFNGIRVPDAFIHIVGGSKGVFVREGSIVKFKKLNPIYSSSGYTVSALGSDESYLQIYDEVIENGDDLYDGKVIK